MVVELKLDIKILFVFHGIELLTGCEHRVYISHQALVCALNNRVNQAPLLDDCCLVSGPAQTPSGS